MMATKKPVPPKEKLELYYVELRYTTKQMEETFDATISTIYKWLDQHDIPRRTKKRFNNKKIDGVWHAYCTTCKLWKPMTEFAQDRSHKNGLKAKCRICDKQQHAQHRADNKDARSAYIAQYHVAHPEALRAASQRRRERKAGLEGSCTTEQIQELLRRSNNTCIHPDKSKCSGPIHIDHIIPVSVEGSTGYIDNMQILCEHHNISKYASIADHRPDHIKRWAAQEMKKKIEENRKSHGFE